ncbi:hypothetical protein ACWDBD_44755 [Streptomyces sp. NPDC001118]
MTLGTVDRQCDGGFPAALFVPYGGRRGRDGVPRLRLVAVELDAALEFGGEADQGVVDAGDVATMSDRREGLGPKVGDPPGVEDQSVVFRRRVADRRGEQRVERLGVPRGPGGHQKTEALAY